MNRERWQPSRELQLHRRPPSCNRTGKVKLKEVLDNPCIDCVAHGAACSIILSRPGPV